MDVKKIGAFIAQVRREKGLTQSELAERIGVTNKAISRWETGRGYPDIELLSTLSEALDVSIQELLDGKRHLTTVNTSDQVSASAICTYSAKQRKSQTKKIVWLTVSLSIVCILFLLLCVIPGLVKFYFSVVGSKNCIIAADYSSITYYGQKYIPLPMNGIECRIGDCMVQEAQVVGSGFLGKLLFGESLYEVKNVPDNELVYLQTDYDRVVSCYYVLESAYDRYAHMVKESYYDCFYLSSENADGYIREAEFSTEFSNNILASSDLCQEYDGGWCISLYAYESNHIFFRWMGDIHKTDDVYYWSPSVYRERSIAPEGYYMSYKYYKIDDSVYSNLSAYFDLFD